MTVIGKRLKELRLKSGMTQSQLGTMINVTKVSICCYEKGTRTPSLETLIDLSNIFKVNIDYLLGNDMYVVSEKNEDYGVKIADEEMDFIQILRNNTKLYDLMLKDPKRFVELIDKKLN